MAQKPKTMEQLKTTFKKGCFTYDMVIRSLIAAIFAQKDGGKVIAYEVIKIKKQGTYERFNKVYSEKEIYPNSNEWGKKGFTYWTLEAARVKFKELNTHKPKIKSAG